MGDYASATDVHTASLEDISPARDSWFEYQITVAEGLLADLVPRLLDVTTVPERDRLKAKQVVVAAVLRYFQNPTGMKSETVLDQSFERFTPASGETGIYFTDSELARFRPAPAKRIGNISVAPPRYGQL